MRRQEGHVEAVQDGPLDLGTALPAHLVEVGVIPHVGDRPREPAVAVVQRGHLGERAPAVQVVLGVQGQSHPDVLAPVPRRRLPRPTGTAPAARRSWPSRVAGPRRCPRWRSGTARAHRP